MNDISKMLDEAIRSEIQELSSLETDSENKTKAIDELVKLYKLRIEETKNEQDVKCRENEEKLKREQLAEQVKDRYFRIGVEAAGIILPLVFYAVWMKRGFAFEETGTFTF